jgi:hypothetical protein
MKNLNNPKFKRGSDKKSNDILSIAQHQNAVLIFTRVYNLKFCPPPRDAGENIGQRHLGGKI